MRPAAQFICIAVALTGADKALNAPPHIRALLGIGTAASLLHQAT